VPRWEPMSDLERVRSLTSRVRLSTRTQPQAEQVEKANPNLMKQFEFAENARIPSIVIVGTDELERGVVKLRSTQSREDRKAKKPGDEREVKRADLVAEIKARR